MWLSLLIALVLPAHATRVKDVTTIYGVRSNPLMGYGLVVGLDRTGDSAQNAAAIRGLAGRLKGLGVALSDTDIKSRNIAMVMVTGTLAPGSRPGSMLDVLVSSAGDARSLEGGILLATPMYRSEERRVGKECA